MKLLIFLAVIGAIAFVVYKLSVKKKANPVQEKDPVNEPEDKTVENISILQDLNLHVRKHSLPECVIQSFESVVDSLRSLLPRVNSERPSMDIVWVVNRIANKHLPEITMRFVSLSCDAQNSSANQFMSSMNELDKELGDINDILDSQDQQLFTNKAEFIRRRYAL
ncbi:MAG: hypothetical protein MRY49_01110 [Candidatus Pacebacteria bacterium]|nr:hypothetical protein [Candidatus Paceibacterota bacterium]